MRGHYRGHLALTQTTAWREATVTVGQIIQDLNGRLRPGRGWRMEVTDEFANRLYVIHLYAEKPK